MPPLLPLLPLALIAAVVIYMVYKFIKNKKVNCISKPALCNASQYCDDKGVCQIDPTTVGASCAADSSICRVGLFCVGGVCTACTTDESLCGPGQKCISGLCIGSPCTNAPDNCTDGKVCVGGNCVTPTPKPECSYSWNQFYPFIRTEVAPYWTTTDYSPYVGGNSDGIPSGAIGSNDRYDLGHTSLGLFGKYSGDFISLDGYWGVQASSACPTTFQSTADVSQAIKFNNIPVCWDFGGDTNEFSAYRGGACDGASDFKLVLNNPPAV